MTAASWRAALRSAAEGALGAAAGFGLASAVWRAPAEVRGIGLGAGVAWLASSLSTASLIWAKGVSTRAFWWAFGGGLALRLSVLAGLMAYSVYHPRLSQPALLLAYAFGVLCLLPLEYRQIRLK